MTLEDLSEKTDIDITYLGRIERNKVNITLDTLDRILNGLGMDESQFFSFLDLESEDPELAHLMRKVKQSPSRKKLVVTIKNIIDLTK